MLFRSDRVQSVLDVRLRCSARLAANGDAALANSLPFCPAESVRPGMVMVDGEGQFSVVVEAATEASVTTTVYDLDIARTHNFVANGIVTHNSIYKFRGADFRNIVRFEEAFPEASVVVLDQNYRSTQRILDAANAVIAHNASRRPKQLWSDQGEGEPVVRY